MAVRILYVGRSFEYPMLCVYRLDPLLGNELRGEELRRALSDLIVPIHHEHVIGPPTVCACRMWGRIGKCVIIVSGRAARRQKACEGVSEPQGTENIHGCLSTMRVCFGVQEWHSRRQPILTPHLHNMSEQLRLFVEVLPRRLAAVIRIVFK